MQVKPGSLLIAPPAMTDSRFSRSVLLVTHNNSAGTFALCLNKPTKHDLSHVSEELNLGTNLPFQLFWGGPVQSGSIWMIHDNNWECSDTLWVNDKWRVTSNESMFHHMVDGDAPRDLRIVYGFCSWMPGQLEMELSGTPPFTKKSSWVIANDVDPEWVFNQHVDELWEDATNLAGNQAVSSWL
jgi:putative transcriptional regulator